MVMHSAALRQSVFSKAETCLYGLINDMKFCLDSSSVFQENAVDFFVPGYVCTMTQSSAAADDYSRMSIWTTCQGKYNEKYIDKLEKERTEKWVGEIQSVVDSALAVFSVKKDELKDSGTSGSESRNGHYDGFGYF